jgi:hypothetical protein
MKQSKCNILKWCHRTAMFSIEIAFSFGFGFGEATKTAWVGIKFGIVQLSTLNITSTCTRC